MQESRENFVSSWTSQCAPSSPVMTCKTEAILICCGRLCLWHQLQSSYLQDAIEDTTGAGDAFIGSMLFGICTRLDPKRCLLLAAVVAAAKCTAVGARSGLPHADRIDGSLLHSC